MFHTTYNSFESGSGGRNYIGKHSSNDPYDDYLGSFKDNSFNPDSKIIMAYSKTAEGAVWFEINFQKVFKVVEDPEFANQAYQTALGFDTTGRPHTPEYKEKRSERMKGEKNPMFGKSGTLSPNFGRPFTEHHKQHMSESKQGIKHPQCKKVRVIFPSGEERIFNYAKEVSEELGCNYPSLKRWCQTNYAPKRGPFLGYSFNYI